MLVWNEGEVTKSQIILGAQVVRRNVFYRLGGIVDREVAKQ